MKKPEFEIQNGELIEYHGAGGDVVIPDGVTRIADFVFDLCETLTSLTLIIHNPSASQKSHTHWFQVHTETVPIRQDSSEAIS